MELVRFSVKALDTTSVLVSLPSALTADDQALIAEAAFEHGLTQYAKLLSVSINLDPTVRPSLCLFQISLDFSNLDDRRQVIVAAHTTGHDLLEALERLTLSLLRQTMQPATLDVVLSKLMPWTRNRGDAVRTASLRILKLALDVYRREVIFEPGTPLRFTQGHHMLAKVKKKTLSDRFYLVFFSPVIVQMLYYFSPMARCCRDAPTPTRQCWIWPWTLSA